MPKDKTTCTLIYQGKTANLDDKETCRELLTPMVKGMIERSAPMKPRQQFLLPELETTAIDLAYMVGQLAALEEEKAEMVKDFKERIDLLKLQIKAAAKAINDSQEIPRVGVTAVKQDQPGAGQ